MFKSGPSSHLARDPDHDAVQLLDVSDLPRAETTLGPGVASMTTTARRREYLSWEFLGICLGLAVTTTLSFLLFIASARGWTLSDDMYWIDISNRATVQLVVQVLSNVLGLVFSSVLCKLINYASRVYWSRKKVVPMDMLLFWKDLCLQRLNFSIQVKFSVALVGFWGLLSAQSALWAGALTPVATTVTRKANFTVPSYQNSSLITEYASEVGASVPQLRNSKGFFTYEVGVQLSGDLLASAASATPVDGEVRQHQKNDNTRFTYYGRSFGMGSSVGLFDHGIVNDTLVTTYTYEETGYNASVTCIYNSSTDFVLELVAEDGIGIFAAHGMLPNSAPGSPEYSTYTGWGDAAIVAIGVGRDMQETRHILGMAAGSSYSNLNTTQCEIIFTPAVFNVSVSVKGRNITVGPSASRTADDATVSFETGNLTHILTRQYELLANAQTNLYASLVGNSLNSSAADYLTASDGTAASLAEATLAGLANAVTAMADDMLVAYAEAQLMVGGFTATTPGVVTRQAMRVGEDAYIYSVFGINIAVVVLLVAEYVRTGGWRGLVSFDYMDLASLCWNSFRGGVAAGGGDEDPENDPGLRKGAGLNVLLEGTEGGDFLITLLEKRS